MLFSQSRDVGCLFLIQKNMKDINSWRSFEASAHTCIKSALIIMSVLIRYVDSILRFNEDGRFCFKITPSVFGSALSFLL